MISINYDELAIVNAYAKLPVPSRFRCHGAKLVKASHGNLPTRVFIIFLRICIYVCGASC